MDIQTRTEHRTVIHRVYTGLEHTDKSGDVLRPAIEYAVYHDANSKSYRVFLDRIVVGPIFVTQVIDFRNGAPDVVKLFDARYSVARFSQKVLDGHADNARHHLEEMTPAVQAELFAWANKLVEKE